LIDLHCHLLPGIDDGSKNLAMSLEMARLACADGITTVVCTPHILPTVYENTGPEIKASVTMLQQELLKEGIPLDLLSGADVHIVPDLLPRLAYGQIITLADSRYLLLEPPHHVMPPQFEECIFRLQSAGYVAILTHPERLSWIGSQFPLIRRMVNAGLWIQLTAGSLTGRFGRRPRYWAERMLDQGLCHVIATDAQAWRSGGRQHLSHQAEGGDRQPKPSNASSFARGSCEPAIHTGWLESTGSTVSAAAGCELIIDEQPNLSLS
jgi:protein-tyrosine phosphatase